MAEEKLTPMMRQYRRIKSELPQDTLLLFRLGDFYELFFEDARLAAPILGVALTQRSGVPMCGVPWHALDSYLAKLIRAGRKTAVCEQVEDPAQARGIVRREVTRVVTPGTVIEDEILEAARNNYLAALYAGETLGLALLDLSTGAFTVESAADAATLAEHLQRHAPSECLVSSGQRADPRLAFLAEGAITSTITEIADWTLAYDYARDLLLRHFAVHSLEGYGCEGQAVLVAPSGALLHYVREELRRPIKHIRTLQVRHADDFLLLDANTCRNLDLLPQRGQVAVATLLGVLDNTLTSMGARMLRHWLVRPLRQADAIRARQDALTFLTQQRISLQQLRQGLSEINDLERLIARIDSGRCNPRELKALSVSLLAIPALREFAAGITDPLLCAIAEQLHPLPHLTTLLESALEERPAIHFRDGGIIRTGFNPELDELRALASQGHNWLATYQAAEQTRTGIKTIKVRFNRVFGYYLEVSKAMSAKVPPEYERRQTLVNAERFVTPELKTYEGKILGAQERVVALEQELFEELRVKTGAETLRIQQTADALAQLDVLCSLADRALALGYNRPEILEGDLLEIRDGRHPVIEQLPDAERFVPNDTLLDCKHNQIMLITGPNMAGKSTYIRQVALIAIMAHIGSFVPARSARISTLDRIFTRVGAGDDLTRGRSTFMVEMQESANILNNATVKSLVVLDELGRGTSTFDGISIAWAVAEHLHNTPGIKAKTLFATHYHELTDLALTLDGVKNYTVQVREHGESVIFLRRITAGSADKSYGIHVARLAGMPHAVVERAREVLANLEESELEAGLPKLAKHSRRSKPSDIQGQMTLFGE